MTVELQPITAFVDMVGVNVHMGYTNSRYSPASSVLSKINDLGIKHVRDGWAPGVTAHHTALNALTSTDVALIVAEGNGTTQADLTAIKAAITRLVALEGPNELDLSGAGWSARLREQMHAFKTALLRDPDLPDFPVLAPSIVWDGDAQAEKDRYAIHSTHCNIHPYNGGVWEANAHADRSLEMARLTSDAPGRKVWATEYGFHTTAAGGWTDHPAVSEADQARYLIAGIHHLLYRGYERIYIYELLDLFSVNSQPNRFGLYRNDGTRKPAAVALKNWLASLGPCTRVAAEDSDGYTLTDPQNGVAHSEWVHPTSGQHRVVIWPTKSGTSRNLTLTMTDNISHWGFVRHTLQTTTTGIGAVSNAKTYTFPMGADPVMVRIVPPA